MFEVLLHADMALESGALDQAERSYWQLIELDPTNAIAVVGLARVSMERGDHRLARTFADQALTMDPEMVAARNILETLKGGAPAPPNSDLPDFPRLAAESLEALGRGRAGQPVTGGPAPESGAEELDLDDMDDAGPPAGFEAASLAERRQAGRRATAEAAAAAELAAAAQAASSAAPSEAARRPQTPPRPKAHQALGDRARRNLLPGERRPRPRTEDPFAAAESAAAIEAVDETDDVVIEAHLARPPSRSKDKVGDALGGIEATGQEESIAMRIALVPDAARLAAAELAEATFGAAVARGEDESVAIRVKLMADAARLEAAELGAAELHAAEVKAAELRAAGIEATAAGTEAPAGDNAAGHGAGDNDVAGNDAAELPSAELESAELNAVDEREAARIDDDVFGVAELVASEELGPAPTHRIDLDALEAELRAAELRAHMVESGEPEAAAEPAAGVAATAGDGGAGPTEATPRADEPVAAGPAPAESTPAEPETARRTGSRTPPPATGEEPSEEDAEAAALREAVALVLGGESDGQGRSGEMARTAGDSTNSPPNPENTTRSGDPEEPAAAGPELSDSGSPATTEPRRKGFLRRFRGD